MRKVSYVKKFWFYPIISAFLSFSYLVYMDGFVSVKDLVQEKLDKPLGSDLNSGSESII